MNDNQGEQGYALPADATATARWRSHRH